MSALESNKAWRHFGKRLEKGRRWWNIKSSLGAGILAIIPSSVVPHSWVERLPGDQFDVWVQLIQRHYSSAIQFASLIKEAVKNTLKGC